MGRKMNCGAGVLSAVALVLMVLLSVSPASAGPIMLSGHDADDHGFQSVYAGLFNNLLSNVTNGGSGILAIGTTSGTSAGTWISGVASLMTSAQTVTFVNGAAAISAQSLAGFAIVHVVSDSTNVSGGIDQAELNALNARSADVATHINGGGGLFGLTLDSLTDRYNYLGAIGAITDVSIPSSGLLPSGNPYDNLTATAAGAALGITNTNLDGCCWHNIFTIFPTFMSVLATANEPLDLGFNGQASIIGGSNVTITPCGGPSQPSCDVVPEPSSVVLMASGLAGLAGYGWRKRRQPKNG